MFSRCEWQKKRYAEDSEFRQKRLAYNRTYRQAHTKEIIGRRRLRELTDPAYRERQLAINRASERRRRLRRIYGISAAEYQAMFVRQGGACAICKRTDRKLCVDHCHVIRKTRCLLCLQCNCMLGFANDDPNILEAGRDYLNHWHAELGRSLGIISVEHVDGGDPGDPVLSWTIARAAASGSGT
jgi:hypothetical protein